MSYKSIKNQFDNGPYSEKTIQRNRILKEIMDDVVLLEKQLEHIFFDEKNRESNDEYLAIKEHKKQSDMMIANAETYHVTQKSDQFRDKWSKYLDANTDTNTKDIGKEYVESALRLIRKKVKLKNIKVQLGELRKQRKEEKKDITTLDRKIKRFKNTINTLQGRIDDVKKDLESKELSQEERDKLKNRLERMNKGLKKQWENCDECNKKLMRHLSEEANQQRLQRSKKISQLEEREQKLSKKVLISREFTRKLEEQISPEKIKKRQEQRISVLNKKIERYSNVIVKLQKEIADIEKKLEYNELSPKKRCKLERKLKMEGARLKNAEKNLKNSEALMEKLSTISGEENRAQQWRCAPKKESENSNCRPEWTGGHKKSDSKNVPTQDEITPPYNSFSHK